MSYFPICLDLAGRPCVVVGGGRVAERKIRGLLDCGATVTVISPELTPGLHGLAQDGGITWRQQCYAEGDLAGAFMVISATDDRPTQEKVYEEAQQRSLLLNVADVPELCNFILPAVVRRGELIVAVSTGGRSPALARRLRRELECRFGPEYGVLVDIMGALRPFVLAVSSDCSANKELFTQLLHDDILVWVREGCRQEMEAHFAAVLGDAYTSSCRGALAEVFSHYA